MLILYGYEYQPKKIWRILKFAIYVFFGIIPGTKQAALSPGLYYPGFIFIFERANFHG